MVYMSTSIKTSLFILLAATAFFLAAFLAVPSAQAGHSWGSYHWARTTTSFTLKLGDNVSTAWDASLTTASTDWSVSTVLDTTIVAGTAGRNCKAVAGTVQVCNARYGANGWLGLAQIWISGSHITQGLAKMNDTYFNTSTYNTPAWRNMVMCQEVGHTFGLGHQDEISSNLNLDTCMDYTSNPESNQHPNTHDYDQLATIYAHTTDSSNSYSTTLASARGASAFAQNGDFENASEWGKVIRNDSRGNPSLYERDLGSGNKVITHVIWAQ